MATRTAARRRRIRWQVMEPVGETYFRQHLGSLLTLDLLPDHGRQEHIARAVSSGNRK